MLSMSFILPRRLFDSVDAREDPRLDSLGQQEIRLAMCVVCQRSTGRTRPMPCRCRSAETDSTAKDQRIGLERNIDQSKERRNEVSRTSTRHLVRIEKTQTTVR